MRFSVIKTRKAEEEFLKLDQRQRQAVDEDYSIIEKKGIEYVKRRALQDGVFEIKTNDVRSLFMYKENQIKIIGLIYVKKTQKAPVRFMSIARKRILEEDE